MYTVRWSPAHVPTPAVLFLENENMVTHMVTLLKQMIG